MDQDDKKRVPPYISFKTFTNFVEGLGVNMPTRIDKTLMKSLSGAVQSQILATLSYFELVESDGKPTMALESLAASKGQEWEHAWKALITKAYPFLFVTGFDLKRATQGEMDERFKAAGVSGETVRKCVAFFIAAAHAAGVPLSPHFKVVRSRGARSGTRRKNATPKRESEPEDEDDSPGLSPPARGSTKVIQLRSGGGAISLTVSIDPMELDDDDQGFAFGLIRLLKKYDEGLGESVEVKVPKRKPPLPPPPPPRPPTPTAAS